MKRLLNLNQTMIFSRLLIILLAGMGLVRSGAFIFIDKEHLRNVSDLYIKMEELLDIQTIGWFLFLFSFVLFLSAFFRGFISQLLLVIGAIVCGTIHILFGMVGVDTANLPSTYYSNLFIGVVQYLVFILGVVELWKNKQ